MKLTFAFISVAALTPAIAPLAQPAQPGGGVIHTIEVSAPSLRGNLLGDSARRAVSVYLPPEYSAQPGRRFPVIYLLHGFSADHKAFIPGGVPGPQRPHLDGQPHRRRKSAADDRRDTQRPQPL